MSAVRQVLDEFQIRAEDGVLEDITKYCELLELWNTKVNLTTVTAPTEVLRRHFAESMLGAQLIDNNNDSVVDVGSGAGFPGLPIKLLRPDLRLTLLEPNIKKAAFLNEVIRMLEMKGVRVQRERFQEFGVASKAEFDVVTARAVGDFDSLLKTARQVLTEGGKILLWLGLADAERIQRLPDWDWQPALRIPGSSGSLILPGRPA